VKRDIPLKPEIIIQDNKNRICEGDSTLLFTQETDLSKYEWYKDNQLISGNNPAIYVKEEGTYSLNIINEDGCSSKSDPIPVEVIKNPPVTLLINDINNLYLTHLLSNAPTMTSF